MTAYGQSYWTRRPASRGPRRRALSGDHSTDIVVIGGGLTGCASAYALAKAGFEVILLERDTIAGGATSRAMGLITPSPTASYLESGTQAGAKATKAAFGAYKKSAKDLTATLKKLKVKCDLAELDLLVNAPFTNDAARLKKEIAARKAAGADAVWVAGAVSRELLQTETQGAMRVRAAVMDPVKAARGFADAAMKLGVRVLEHTAAVKTTFTRKDVTVALKGARITARGVVVATGMPETIGDQLMRHVRVSQGYVVVTNPLTTAMRAAVGSREVAYTEATESPRWLRWLPDGRAMFAGITAAPAKPALAQKAVIQRANQLMYELSLRYPDISGLPPAFGWDMPIVTAPDGLPWIGSHRNYPFHFFSMALGWHGEAGAWLAAQAAVRHFSGKPAPEDGVLGFTRIL
ncbi:MAG: oxidoreductase [Acidimicrobiia bacterium]